MSKFKKLKNFLTKKEQKGRKRGAKFKKIIFVIANSKTMIKGKVGSLMVQRCCSHHDKDHSCEAICSYINVVKMWRKCGENVVKKSKNFKSLFIKWCKCGAYVAQNSKKYLSSKTTTGGDGIIKVRSNVVKFSEFKLHPHKNFKNIMECKGPLGLATSRAGWEGF